MSKMQQTNANDSASLPKTVRIHPTAILSIINNHMRRSDRNQRVIGTLLGNIKDNIVEVTDCFGFPHQESVVEGKISVILDVQMSQAMFSFHRRVNKTEQVVGWFATTVGPDGAQITEYSSLINEFYNGQCAHPVHIVVDTALMSDTMTPRGYLSRTIAEDGNETTVFDDLLVELEMTAGEKVGLHAMLNNHEKSFPSSTLVSTMPAEKTAVQHAVDKLHKLLEEVQVYVQKVKDGSLSPSSPLGAAVLEAIDRLALVEAEDLAGQVRERSQDVALLSYLTTLIQAQVQIAERIHSVL